MRIGGRDWTFEGEVLELQPERRIAVCTRGRGLVLTSTYDLEPAERGSRLTVHVRTEFTRVFARLLEGIVEREGQRKLETDLERLRALVESEPGR
jgi:Polyketide cyclase / dehydrase and lipid transport